MKFMMKILWFFIPDCKEASHLISLSHDETLSFGKKIGLKMHLMICKFCRRYEKQLRLISCKAKESSEPFSSSESSPKLSDDAKSRLKNLLDQ